jgi:hypothetical protein
MKIFSNISAYIGFTVLCFVMTSGCGGRKGKGPEQAAKVEQNSREDVDAASSKSEGQAADAGGDGIQQSAEIIPDFALIKGRRLMVFDDRDEGLPERYELVLSRELSVSPTNFVVAAGSNMISSPANAGVKGHRIAKTCTQADRDAIYGDAGQIKPVLQGSGVHQDVANADQILDDLEVLEADVNPTLRCSTLMPRKETDDLSEPGLVIYGYVQPNGASENFVEAVKWVKYIVTFPEQPDVYYAMSTASLKALLKEKLLTEDSFTSNYQGPFNFASLFSNVVSEQPVQRKKIFGFNVVDSLPTLSIAGMDGSLQTENASKTARSANIVLGEDESTTVLITSNDLELDAVSYQRSEPNCGGLVNVTGSVEPNGRDYKITIADKPEQTTIMDCKITLIATSNLTGVYTLSLNVHVLNNLRDWCEYVQNSSLNADQATIGATKWLLEKVGWVKSGETYSCSDVASLTAANARTSFIYADSVEVLETELKIDSANVSKLNPIKTMRALATLKNLETLEIATKDLNLSDVNFLPKLTKLKRLVLRGHSFQTANLASANILSYVDLSGNRLDASPVFHGSAPLAYVDLSMNRLSAVSIPSQSSFATKTLETINVMGNYISGLPALASTAWPLKYLSVSVNAFGSSANLASYTNLREMFFAYNQGITPGNLSTASLLQVLDIGRTDTTCSQWTLSSTARCVNKTMDYDAAAFCQEFGKVCP